MKDKLGIKYTYTPYIKQITNEYQLHSIETLNIL